MKHLLMSEETGGEQPTGGGTPPETPPSGLPSDTDNQPKFEVNADDLKDGKFDGRWNTPQEMSDYIKNIEDKHATLTREVADKTKATDADLAATAAELQTKQAQTDLIGKLAPEFIENGMSLTDDMREQLKDTGLTEDQIKLGVYEVKAAIDKNANYVGGKENYDIIMDYHAENMSDDEKRAFNHSIQNPAHSEALMVGLQSIYERSLGQDSTQPVDRVRGNSPANTNTIKAYESKAELLRDKAYADSKLASTADKAKFRARFQVTPEKVWLS